MPAPETIVTRDLIDMATTAGELATTLTYAGKKIGWCGEWGEDREILDEGLTELRGAHAALGRLIAEIEREVR